MANTSVMKVVYEDATWTFVNVFPLWGCYSVSVNSTGVTVGDQKLQQV